MNPDQNQTNQTQQGYTPPNTPPAPGTSGMVGGPLIGGPAPTQQYSQASQPIAQQPAPQAAPGSMLTPGQNGEPAEQTPPPANADKKGANSAQNALQVAEVRDGIVIMNDGSFRSVVMAKSINFDLMSPEEREAVEYAYQGFLNSLYFPVQFFIRSSRVDIRPYIEKLDRLREQQDNMLLALMMDDYIDFIAALSEETNIMDKRFYVVIPYYQPVSVQAVAKGSKKIFGSLFSAFTQNKAHPIIKIDEAALNTAKTELTNRVQAVISGLMNVGVQSIALDTEELIELYYDTYNPDTATRQQLRSFADMTAPVIAKGEGQAANPNLELEQ